MMLVRFRQKFCADDDPVFVNPQYVASIHSCGRFHDDVSDKAMECSTVHTCDGGVYAVVGSVEDVAQRLCREEFVSRMEGARR